MDTLKKVGLVATATIAVLFLIWWSLDSFGFRSPISALLVNWLAMSWIAVIGQAVPLSFSAGYYGPRSFEQSGQVYERLGVTLFKKLVRRGPLTLFSPTLRFPKEKSIANLQHLDGEMRHAEAGHAIIFILMLLFAVYILASGWLDAAGWIVLFNVLLNGYPVMLQRYNRIKLQELVDRQERLPAPRLASPSKA
jgi:hypothetical protein